MPLDEQTESSIDPFQGFNNTIVAVGDNFQIPSNILIVIMLAREIISFFKRL